MWVCEAIRKYEGTSPGLAMVTVNTNIQVNSHKPQPLEISCHMRQLEDSQLRLFI